MLSFKFCNRFHIGLDRTNTQRRALLVVTRSNEPGDVFGKLKDRKYLEIAAKKFALGECACDI